MADYTGEILGYGSAFSGEPDSYGDVMVSGCFSRTLREWKAQRRGPQMLWMHDLDVVVGTWTDFREDDFGLRMDGMITLAASRGADTHALLASRAVDGLSIGFRTRKARVDEKTGIRYILDVDLYEVSIVGFPANLRARVDEVRQQKTLLELLEDRKQIFLTPETRTDDGLRALLTAIQNRNAVIAGHQAARRASW